MPYLVIAYFKYKIQIAMRWNIRQPGTSEFVGRMTWYTKYENKQEVIMENKKDKTQETIRDLASKANAQPNPKDYSNTANIKGGVNKGQHGTKPTASQQHGQGAANKKDNK
ncbi:hypothetical protein [Pontibacter mangrovi]|uniref:Uncharacterized protein n=1 Tax=Pontibacter mangrovi TaxID=2589816 RepID=A0A501VQI0_9BACT|nr:hypothetical protein [Pontibacter mangrovi]TPE39993.1 hypothetical protein FJM65_20500 [Pontibacter mangrovi]